MTGVPVDITQSRTVPTEPGEALKSQETNAGCVEPLSFMVACDTAKVPEHQPQDFIVPLPQLLTSQSSSLGVCVFPEQFPTCRTADVLLLHKACDGFS